MVGYGRPASTPSLPEMWQTWRDITAVADEFLNVLTTEQLTAHLVQGETTARETTGTMLLRNIYHYWFHTGEAHAVRQQLGHTDLPQFVGDEYGRLPARIAPAPRFSLNHISCCRLSIDIS